MAVALDQAYVLAEEAIERTDVDSFKEILAEFPNLDIYNENTTGADGTSVGWRQPLLGIAIDQENTAIVNTILALEAYNIKKPLYYEDIVGFGPKITAIQYAQDKRRELLQESSPETVFIDYIIEELNNKINNQAGGKRVNRRRSKSRRSKSRRHTTSRRRRH